MNIEIEKYITKRYDRWLDYSTFHCARAGLQGEAIDVLNEVMLSILSKDENSIIKLINSKKGGYTEFDFYVLQSIKLNALSNTAPYRAKNRNVDADDNVDWQTLEIEDEEYVEEDKTEHILLQMNLVRKTIDELNLSEHARSIFEYKFFKDGEFVNYPGDEAQSDLYKIYASVLKLIRDKIDGNLIF